MIHIFRIQHMYCLKVFSRKTMIKIKIVLMIDFWRKKLFKILKLLFFAIFLCEIAFLLSVFLSQPYIVVYYFCFSDIQVSWYPTECEHKINTVCWTTYGGYRLWCGRFWMLGKQIKLKQPRWLSKKEHKKTSLYWILYKDLVTLTFHILTHKLWVIYYYSCFGNLKVLNF